MTLRRIPIIPTVLVLIAVGVMVRLGFWQIDRMHQKGAMLARYSAAERAPLLDLDSPPPPNGDIYLYRKVRFECYPKAGAQAMSGRNDRGEAGWAHLKACHVGGFPDPRNAGRVVDVYTDLVMGWSNDPSTVEWKGGWVSGTVGPSFGSSVRVVADPPLAGLQPNARPDPKDLPNNHWSYAIQWFLFAATALVIYGLALRKRLAVPDPAS